VGALDDSAVDEEHREAAARWPGVHVSRARFGEVLARAAETTELPLARLHTADLYLVAACLDGDEAAIAALERDVIGRLRGAIRRACRDDGAVDDVVQTTLASMLAGPPSPKLAQYMGLGALSAWVRVVAVREALQARHRTRRELLTDADLLAGPATSTASVELRVLRDLHGPSFGVAIKEAMRRLTAEQRALLRFSVRDRLSIDRIAPMLGIHRATAARRLEQARADVLEHTQAILCEHHGLSESEARSLCTALGRDVDVSLGRALTDEAVG